MQDFCKRFCKLLLLIIIYIAPNSLAVIEKKLSNQTLIKSDTLLKADEVVYESENDIIIASGNIFIQIDEYSLTANKIKYHLQENILYAEGDVRITTEKGQTIYGNQVVFKDKLKTGVIKEFILKLGGDVIITSRLAEIISEKHVKMKHSVYTPCLINCGKNPIWQINAAETDINLDEEKIKHKNLFFEVYGIPIAYLPYFLHPTPNASSQSGFLMPKLSRNEFIMPFYWRMKTNADFTLAPRIARNYQIYEGHFRHLIEDGSYEIKGSIGNPAKINKSKKTSSLKKFNRFYLNAFGEFHRNDINYGFSVKRTSDKAYLANYQNEYDSYLASELYANKVSERDYFSVKSFYFQDLRRNNEKKKTPIVLPHLKTQLVFDLKDDNSLMLKINNDFIMYKGKDGNQQVAREALNLELMSNIMTDSGNLYTFTAGSRGDIYWVRESDLSKNLDKQRNLYRTIPNVSAKWRLPIIGSISNDATIKLEPTAMIVLGKNYKRKYSKFGLIDSPENELSENNLFNINRFDGVDYHDYGKRFSCGLNASFMKNLFYINGFMGTLVHSNNVHDKGNSEYVGSISASIDENLQLFYRTRREKNLKPIRNEIGVNFNSKKTQAKFNFTELKNLSKHFVKTNLEDIPNKASQAGLDLDYEVNERWSVGGTTKVDLTNKKAKELLRSIRVTYQYDCVRIQASLTDNFISDSSRGVKKTKSSTISIGLKSINL